jgi:hypothetical protein
MNIHEANTKSLGPAWTFIAGFALLAVGCGMLCFVIIGLWTGEIWRLSKYHQGLVTRQDSPDGFWCSEFFSFIIGLMLSALSLRILRDGFRERLERRRAKRSTQPS